MRGSWLGRWSIVAIVVFFVGVVVAEAILKTAHLSWPPLIPIAALAVLSALIGLSKPVVGIVTQVLGTRLNKRVELAETRRGLVQSVEGTTHDLRRVQEVTDRSLLRIHPAIPLPENYETHLSPDLPTYVPRQTDANLRTWFTANKHKGGFALLVGWPAAGKTRSLYEALQDTVPEWRLFLPNSSAQITDLVGTGMDLSETVVWLNDIHRFLGTDGLSAGIVHRLLADRSHPVFIVGTIWPDMLDTLTRPPKGNEDGHATADAREILSMLVSKRFEIMTTFDTEEIERARQLAEQDPRLAEAVSLDDQDIARTLAAAPELINRLRNPANQYGGIIITAAAIARRCGHPEPLPPNILEELAEHLLTPTQRASAKDDWFRSGIDWASENVRGEVAPLTARSSTVGEVDGYHLSDILFQYTQMHPGQEGNETSEAIWSLLIEHATAEACIGIGLAANREEIKEPAKKALLKASNSGIAYAMHTLGTVLFDLGEAVEAEEWWKRAVEAGDTDAVLHLGEIFDEQGRQEEAQSWYRRVAQTGNIAAMNNLGLILRERHDEDEAEEWLRRAADSDLIPAMLNLALLLRERHDEGEAEEWLRRATDSGSTEGMHLLANLLRDQGHENEAEEWWKRAVEAGDTDAVLHLARLFDEQGRQEEAQSWYRRAAQTGNTTAMNGLALLLSDQGDEGEAEEWLRRSADSDLIPAMLNLALLLRERHDEGEAEEWLRRATDSGSTEGMHLLAKLLRDQGHENEAEEWLRRATAGAP